MRGALVIAEQRRLDVERCTKHYMEATAQVRDLQQETAKLQDDVSLGGGSVAKNLFAVGPER